MIRERETSSDWCRSRLESFSRYFFCSFVSGFSSRNSEPGSIWTNRVGFHLRYGARTLQAQSSLGRANGEKRCDLRGTHGGRQETTGQFIIPGLSPGTYEVTVTSSGFAPFKGAG